MLPRRCFSPPFLSLLSFFLPATGIAVFGAPTLRYGPEGTHSTQLTLPADATTDQLLALALANLPPEIDPPAEPAGGEWRVLRAD